MKPRLRVAILSRKFDFMGGGVERYAVALAGRLAAQHEVHVFAQHIANQAPGLTYHRLPAMKKPRWLNQLLFAYLAHCRTRAGFDIVHAHENGWAGNVQTVYVRPTREDTFGMVVLEATMAFGLPVVVSRAPWCGLAADLNEQETRLLDHPDDAQALAQAIQRLLSDEVLRARLVQNGPVVAARYAWDDIAKRHEALYHELLEARCAS